jgi:hypothetical protein
MRADSVLAVALLLAASASAVIVHRRHSHIAHSSAPTVRERRSGHHRSRPWTSWFAAVRLPQVMSYWYPMIGAYYVPPTPAPVKVWDHAQLMFVSNDNGDLVLDFLVPDPDAPRHTSMPVTLHAHQLSGRESATDLRRAIGAWVTTSAFVDVELRRAGDRRLMRIHERHSVVTLELLTASGIE